MYFHKLMVSLLNILFVLSCFTVHINADQILVTTSIHGLLPTDLTCKDFVDGIPVFYSSELVKFHVFGNNLSDITVLGLSKKESCANIVDNNLRLSAETKSKDHVAVLFLTTPATGEFYLKNVRFYVCAQTSQDPYRWKYLGCDDRISFYVYKPILVPIVNVILIIICFSLSSLMSGLNIGLMALDPHELSMLKACGTKKEKKYAKTIYSVRRNGNYLLCSILITATLCNSIATVSIDNVVSNWVAVFITTVVIVFFCEILPQAICTYFPLYIGYHTIYVTKACMIFTAPVSYPLSKLLNLILGKEIAATVTKERLKELLKVTVLPTNEQRIISGTLDLSQKKVEDVMTLIDDIYKLPINAVMDFGTIASIIESGFSRIPIYVGEKSNIRYVLFTKDLALLDPGDKVPVKVLVQNSKYVCTYIPADTALDEVFKLFKESRGHMVFVVEQEEASSDKDKSVIGLVTFEDIIEEIFQAEINDETDAFSDNRNKRKISKHLDTNHLLSLLSKQSNTKSSPSENLKLAAFHFLSDIDVFSSKFISQKCLLSLLSLDVYYSAPGQKSPDDSIYVQGVPSDYFVMILEGGMELRIGNENLKFEAGAFKYFGVDALKVDSGQTFTPDYSLLAVKRTLYVKITQELYNAAILATKYERTKELPDINTKSDLYKYFKLIVGNELHTPQSKRN